MKKLLSLLIALCMLLPVFALGESANAFESALVDGKALATEVSFTPGTLPNDLASFQAVFADVLKMLSVKSVVQAADGANYQSTNILFSGESVLSLGALIKGDVLTVFSEVLGDQPVAITKDELVKLADENVNVLESSVDPKEVKAQITGAINALFGGTSAVSAMDVDKQMAAFAALGTDLMATFAGYAKNAVITQGEYKRDGADVGATSINITLSNQDIREGLVKIGETIQKHKEAIGAQYAIALKDAWDQMLTEFPQNISMGMEAVLDKDGALAFATQTVFEDDKAVGEINLTKLTQSSATQYTLKIDSLEENEKEAEFAASAIVSNDKSQVKLEIQEEDDGLVRINIKTDAVDGKPMTKLDVRVEVFEINEDASVKQLLVPQADFGFGAVFQDVSDTQKRVDVTLLWEDKALLTVNTQVSVVDALPLPDASNAVNIAQLTPEQLEQFGQVVVQNAMLLVQEAMTKLPQSVLMLLQSMT